MGPSPVFSNEPSTAAPIQRNANSLQPDPVSLQRYPNRTVQPSWNQHHEFFHHSYWDISIFIVRNHPYFTSPSPAAPMCLALLGKISVLFWVTDLHSVSVWKKIHRDGLKWCHWRRHTGNNVMCHNVKYVFDHISTAWKLTAEEKIIIKSFCTSKGNNIWTYY